MVKNNTYSFDEIMSRFDIMWTRGDFKGLVISESDRKDMKRYNSSIEDVARIGAVVMRLEDEIKRLKSKGRITKHDKRKNR